MIRRMLIFAAAALSAASALGYRVNTAHNVFYFENQEVKIRTQDGAGWLQGNTIHNVNSLNDLTDSNSTPSRFYIGIEKPGVAVKGWGISTSQNIGNASWDYVASTNYSCSYNSAYKSYSSVYLYVWLKWMRYGITFESNGGSNVEPLSNICYTNSIALPTPSRTGYTYEGWTNTAITAAFVGSKTGSDFDVADDGTNITFYAKWTPKTFEVSFDKNGGGDAVSPTATQVTYDALYGELPSPTWTGHAFSGWFTEASGGSQVTSNTTVKITSAQTLYAHWATNTYTVTFNPNGGSTPTSSKTVTYGETYGVLPTPTWEHRNFAGWFTDSTGGTKVEASDTVEQANDITLYAQWTSDEYLVVFYDTDNTVLLSTNVTYGTKLTPPAVTLGANQFLKWWYDGAVNYSPIQPIDVKGDMTLYPELETRQATLTLVCSPESGGSAVLVEGSLSGDAGRSVKVAADPGAAYSFSGWSDGASALTNTVTLVTNTTLTAYFSKKTFAVSFLDWDGETLLSEQTVEYGDDAVAPDDPTNRVGYTFASWNADFSHVISNMTVVAQYEANRYTVVYDANGGGGAMTNDVFTYDVEYPLQSNNYTRTLHTFLGWASSPDATTNEVEYADGAIVSNLTAVANGTNTLYAVWNSLLSDLSVAADCTNLILTCSNANQLWEVDATTGYAGGSSVKTVGNAVSKMTAEAAGVGTVSFWTKTISSGVLLFNEKPQGGISTDGEWKFYSFELGDADSFLWRGTMYDDDSAVCWVDQIHWYPNRFVTVENNKLTDEEKNVIKEAILQSWDVILGADAALVSTVIAKGPAVTNAVALLNGGYRPEVDTSVVPPTLTFNEVIVLDVSISEFSVTNLPIATLKAALSPHNTPPAVRVWGAPTLTSGWSQIESEGDFSKFAAEGIVSFEFDVSTNRFFKVITK